MMDPEDMLNAYWRFYINAQQELQKAVSKIKVSPTCKVLYEDGELQAHIVPELVIWNVDEGMT